MDALPAVAALAIATPIDEAIMLGIVYYVGYTLSIVMLVLVAMYIIMYRNCGKKVVVKSS